MRDARPLVMGSYGIGLGRLMAAVIHEEAPFTAALEEVAAVVPRAKARPGGVR